MVLRGTPTSRCARIVATRLGCFNVIPCRTSDSASGCQRRMAAASSLATLAAGAMGDETQVGTPLRSGTVPRSARSTTRLAAVAAVDTGIANSGSRARAGTASPAAGADSSSPTAAPHRFTDSRHKVAWAMATSMAHGDSQAIVSGRPSVMASDRNASNETTNARDASVSVISNGQQ